MWLSALPMIECCVITLFNIWFEVTYRAGMYAVMDQKCFKMQFSWILFSTFDSHNMQILQYICCLPPGSLLSCIQFHSLESGKGSGRWQKPWNQVSPSHATDSPEQVDSSEGSEGCSAHPCLHAKGHHNLKKSIFIIIMSIIVVERNLGEHNRKCGDRKWYHATATKSYNYGSSFNLKLIRSNINETFKGEKRCRKINIK